MEKKLNFTDQALNQINIITKVMIKNILESLFKGVVLGLNITLVLTQNLIMMM